MLTLTPFCNFALHPASEAPETFERWETEGFEWPAVLGRDPFAQETHDLNLALARSIADDAFVGLVLLHPVPAREALAFFIWIAPPFRRQGHAAGLGKCLLKAAFAQGYRRVETVHRMDSPGAERLAESLGLLAEGVQRGAYRAADGSPIDLAHWGLLASDR